MIYNFWNDFTSRNILLYQKGENVMAGFFNEENKNQEDGNMLPIEVAQMVTANYIDIKAAFAPELLDDAEALKKAESMKTNKELVRANVLQKMFEVNGEYDGWVFIYEKKKGQKMKRIARCLASELYPTLISLNMGDKQTEYFISKNSFKGNKKRKTCVFSLHNIVIDINMHKLSSYDAAGMKAMKQDVENLTRMICEGAFDNLAPWLCPPSLIVNTGRGVQVWWNIEQASSELKKSYEKLIGMIENLIRGWIVKNTDFCVNINHKRNINPADLVRVPGTFNMLAGMFGYFFCHKGIGLNHFTTYQIAYKEKHPYAKEHQVNENHVKHEFNENKITDFYNMDSFLKRKDMLKTLAGLRIVNHTVINASDFLYILCASGMNVGFTSKELMEECYRFNDNFPVPLEKDEIAKELLPAIRKKIHVSTDYIIDFLEITDEEKDILNIHSKRKMKEEAEARAKEKIEAEEKIYKLTLKNCSISKIAAELNMPENTVRDIVNRNAWTLFSEREMAEAAVLLDKGYLPSEVLRLHPDVSRATVYNLKNNIEKRNRAILQVERKRERKEKIVELKEEKKKKENELEEQAREAKYTADFQAYKVRKTRRINSKNLMVKNRAFVFSARTTDYGIRYGILVIYGSHDACMKKAGEFLNSMNDTIEIFSLIEVTKRIYKKLSSNVENMIPAMDDFDIKAA